MFWLIVFYAIIATIILWFCLAGLFKPTGKIAERLYDDAMDAMKDNDKEKEN